MPISKMKCIVDLAVLTTVLLLCNLHGIEGQCVQAGHTDCCVPDNAAHCLTNSSCWCDLVCYGLADCCADIAETCLLPILQIEREQYSVDEGDSIEVCVLYSGTPTALLSPTVDVSTENGTASETEDFIAINMTFVLSESNDTQCITVDIVDDSIMEDSETFYVTLTSLDTITINVSRAAIEIQPNDAVCIPSCENGGVCVYPGVCSCIPGWTGSSCRVDINECVSDNGGCDQVCINLAGSYECSCIDGFSLEADQYSCRDIDECEIGTDNCSMQGSTPAQCINTIGGFRCSCDDHTGFRLNHTDFTSCEDVNECETANGGCEHICINTEGSFNCSCHSGYEPSENDGLACVDIDECGIGTHNCSTDDTVTAMCANIPGGFRCSCAHHAGYTINKQDYNSCVDIDECQGDVANGGCVHLCENSEGSFSCRCHDGYRLIDDGFNCNDINECEEDNGGCEHICVNEAGRHKCECQRGFELQFQRMCKALECPSLKAPRNGTTTCSGNKTGNLCTFVCNAGYILVGSRARICRPSRAWTGQTTICEPRLCEQLQPPQNGFVLLPCTGEYASSCTIQCTAGYKIEGFSQQTCVLDARNMTLMWTVAPVCIETNICDSQPCRNNGTCIQIDGTSFNCNCEETGYTGPTCDTGTVSVSVIPNLVQYEVSDAISITASPGMEIIIMIDGEDSVEILPRRDIKIIPPSTTETFTVRARRPGLFSLGYQVFGLALDAFVAPDKSVFFVRMQTATNPPENNYFNTFKTTPDSLVEPCCISQAPYFQCPQSIPMNRVIFKAGCLWDSDENSSFTSGLVFVANQGFALPLSIAGVNANKHAIATTLPESQTSDCRPCDQSGPCQPNINRRPSSCQCYHFTNFDTLDFLRGYVLASTYIQHILPLLPSWIQSITVNGSTSPESFAEYEYITDVVNPNRISELQGCDQISKSDQGIYSVLRYGRSIAAEIDSQHVVYSHGNQPLNKPMCFVVNLCEQNNSSLSIQLSMPAHNILVSEFFQEYVVRGWDIQIHSIELSNSGDLTPPPLDLRNYWNGASFFQPQLSHYDVFTKIAAQAYFQTPTLYVEMNFHGQVFYQYQDQNGIMVGETEVMISTEVERENATLVLTSNDASIVNISSTDLRDSMCLQNEHQGTSIPSGISLKLRYMQHPGQRFFSRLLVIPEDSECSVDSFMNLDANLELQQLSLHSQCLHLSIGRLVLPEMDHSIYFAGNRGFSHHCLPSEAQFTGLQPSFLINSTLKMGRRVVLGRFLTLCSLQNNVVALSLAYSTSFFARMYSVRVSLLEAEFLTHIDIDSSKLQFSATENIFQHYSVFMTVSAPVNETPWETLQLSILGVMHGSFADRVESTTHSKLRDIGDLAIIAKFYLNTALQTAQQRLIDLQQQLEERRRTLAGANESYHDALIGVTTANIALELAQVAFDNASMEVHSLQQTLSQLCMENVCEDVCMNGTDCTICYSDTFVEEIGRCAYVVNETRSIRVEPFYKVRTTSRARYLCRGQVRVICSENCQIGPQQICNGRTFVALDRVPVYNWVEIQVPVRQYRPCTVRVLNTTTARTCCTAKPCAIRSPDPSCLRTNAACRATRERVLNDLARARESITEPFQLLDEARMNLSLANVEVSESQAHLENAQQHLNRILPTYNSARIAVDHVNASHQVALAEMQDEFQILELLLNTQYQLQNVFRVLNITFDVTIVTGFEVSFPLMVTYETPYNGQLSQQIVNANFKLPEQLLFGHIAEELIQAIFFNSSMRMRSRRQEPDIDSNREQFAINCADLQSVEVFFSEMAESLRQVNNSIAHARDMIEEISTEIQGTLDSDAINFTVLEAVFNLSSNIQMLEDDASNDGEIIAHTALLVEYQNLRAEQLRDAENISFPDWQTQRQILYDQSSSIGGYPCFSFSDCLLRMLEILKRLISDTPGSNSQNLLIELPDIRDEVLELATSNNLTIPDALERADKVLAIIHSYMQENYWCSSPPEITLQPPAEVNVSTNGTLSLTCEAESDLPITYQWRKDGGTIPGANSSHLVISNLQRLDSGNYSCHVSNAVGTIPSINTSVLVYELPQFYLTLVPTSAYEGDENGAWFACNATAWPFPGWRWYFRPSEGSQFTVIDGEDTNELLIPSPQKENEGWYTCEAFNGHGSIRDDPVFLRVLPVTVSQQAIPVQFQIMSDIPLPEGECSDTESLQARILRELEELIDNANNFIADLEIREETANVYAIRLSIVSVNVTGEHIYSNTLLEIANRAVPTRVALQRSRRAIETAVQSEHSFECENTTIHTVTGSIAFRRTVYICPQGQQLLSNFLLCVSCEPGSYSDVTEQTRVFSGEALTERVPVCRPCPTGTYEPRVGSSQCMSCPEFHTTASTGATSADECMADPFLMDYSASGTSAHVIIDCLATHPPSTTLCSFDGGVEHACDLPIAFNLRSFGPGNHTLRIVASDSIGSTAEQIVSYFLHDTRTNFLPDVPPLAIYLINGSPVVNGSTVQVDFVLTRLATSVTCQIARNEQQDCSSGSITFTDLDPGSYTLRIAASNSRVDRAFLRRRFEITSDTSLCILHLINDGVTVEDDQATVEFAGTGPAESFTCKLNDSPSFTCTTPVVLSALQAGDHTLRIIPSGCGRNRRPLRVDFQV